LLEKTKAEIDQDCIKRPGR